MTAGVPHNGDVVVSHCGPDASPAYVLRTVPGADQFGYATRGEAEQMARAYAAHARVDVWWAESPHTWTLLARGRGSTSPTPRSADATIGARFTP
jgi:hypothetical protein